MKRSLAALCVGLALALSLTACSGGGADVRSENRIEGTTKGQQLLDLKKAYDQGVISQSEYEKQRDKILNSN